MLNKGFKFFGQGSSKKFQVSAQKVPWPFILSRIGKFGINKGQTLHFMPRCC